MVKLKMIDSSDKIVLGQTKWRTKMKRRLIDQGFDNSTNKIEIVVGVDYKQIVKKASS